MRIRLNLLTLAATVIGLLLIPTVAFAYAPTGDDFITCVAGGDSNIECVAGVFEEGCAGTFEAVSDDGSVVAAGDTTAADADGEVGFDFDVATDEETDIRVTVECGAKVLSDVIANVNAEGEVIANAGSNAGLLALGALGAIGIGGGALYVSKRKQSGTTA